MKSIGFCILIFILLQTHPAAATEDGAFESEILLGKEGLIHARLHMSGTRYRLETGGNGGPSSILVDVKSGQTNIINAHQKTYRPIPTRTRQSLALNPIEVFRLVSGFYTQQPGGRETINGLNCRKTTYLIQDRQLITAWFSEDISIPVKAVNHRFPEMNFELMNIRRGIIKPELLKVPTGYQRITGKPDRGATATEWAVKAGGAETVTLEEDKPFKLMIADDESDGHATRGKMIFLRNAPPPIDRVKAPLRLSNGGSLKLTYPASALIKAIEFHVSEGGVHIKQVNPK